MSFAHPFLVPVALGFAAAFAWLYWLLQRRERARALAYSNLAFALAALRPRRWPGALLFGGIVLGVATVGLALAGPRFDAAVPIRDGSVMICIDTSGSMRARDLEPTRSEAARSAARAFVAAVPDGTRIGIASFSYGASLIAPLSPDKPQILEAIGRIPPPDGATAMGDCLALAAQQLPAKGRRAIVLLTDGVNNRGADPLEASRRIGETGIAIETVGVGTNGSGEIIPGTNEAADIDEDSLREIARNGQGRYVAAADTPALVEAFESLARDTVWERGHIDASFPAAILGAVVLVLSFTLGFGAGRFP